MRQRRLWPVSNDQQGCRFRPHHPQDLIYAGPFHGDGVRAQSAGSQLVGTPLQNEVHVGSLGGIRFGEDRIRWLVLLQTGWLLHDGYQQEHGIGPPSEDFGMQELLLSQRAAVVDHDDARGIGQNTSLKNCAQ
jgi:hypothetical protein